MPEDESIPNLSRIFVAGDGTIGTIETDRDQADPSLVRVEIHDRSVPFVAAADVRAGLVQRIEYRAQDGERITHRMIRNTNLVTFFERWATLADQSRELYAAGDQAGALKLFAGGPEGSSAQELLEHLEQSIAEHRTSTNRKRARGADAHDLMERVVAEYKRALDAGDPRPRASVARRLGYSSEHIGRILVRARRTNPPLLGPARPGRAGEETPS